MAVFLSETLETKFQLTIIDANLLMSERFAFHLRELHWYFDVEKTEHENGDSSLDVHLGRLPQHHDSFYSCIASAQIELKSFDENRPSYIGRIAPREFSTMHPKWSLTPFIDWDQLIDPASQYIADDNKQIQMVADKPKRYYENPAVRY